MRPVSFALPIVFLVSIHAQAADPPVPPPPPGAPPTTGAAPARPPAAAPAPAHPPAPTTAPPAPRAGDAPPSEYYVEPPGDPNEAPPPGPPPNAPPPPPPPADGREPITVFEPPPPGYYSPGVYEPPPPPEPHHVAPRTALWLGARVGWFIPFGNVYSRGSASADGQFVNLKGVPWSDYASSGPMFELDAGARLSRNYTVFALWERAQLGSGGAESNVHGGQTGGDTDFWAVALRANSDPDHVGFVSELAIGYRRARAKWDDGTELQFTDAPFEARLGFGAEIRVNEAVSLTPLFTVGVGSFGKVERLSNGSVSKETTSLDEADGHAWAALTLGGSFDLLGRK